MMHALGCEDMRLKSRCPCKTTRI